MHRNSPSQLRWLFALLLLVGLLLPGLSALAQFGDKHPVTPSIIAEATSIQPGQTVTIAVHLEIEPKWHLYWLNPEGPGLTPTVDWSLPEGYTISEPRWPAPKPFASFESYQFGYEKSLTLIYDLTAPQDATGSAALSAGLTWLVCDEGSICVNSPDFPGPTMASLQLPVSTDTPQVSSEAALIAKAEAKVPRQPEGWAFTTEVVDDGFVLVIQAPSEADAQALEGLYFFSSQLYAIDPVAEQTLTVDGKTARLALVGRKADLYGDPVEHESPITRLTGVLTAKKGFDSDGPASVVVGQPTFHTPSQADAGQQPSGTDGADKPAEAGAPALGFLPALGLAFLGGMILNIMPCVFPVLSLKILGFVQTAGERPAIVRRHGYAFGVGVLLSFWVLVGILLAVRGLADAAGGGASWGFQLQNPIFVLAMLLLVFLIGLNLIGAFEFGMSLSAAAGKASQTVQSDGYGKSFFTGVLATLIATPCTGPLMAPAIGAALSMTTVQAFLVFTSLGVGMALPYVLLSCFPKLLAVLPKPGAWMESFKQAMAFPMFATAGWLAWIYLGLVSEDFGLVLFVGLSVVAMGVWVYGRWSTPINTPRVKWTARLIALALVVTSVGYLHKEASSIRYEIAEAERARVAGEYVYEWMDYSPAAIAGLRASNRPVLIDFTGRNCAICQANKKTSLRTDAAKALYKEHNVALVVADYTNSNPAIGKVLEEYQRAGVPLYLVFPAGDPGAQPEMLPEVLTPQIVEDAIKRAVAKPGGDNSVASSN